MKPITQDETSWLKTVVWDKWVRKSCRRVSHQAIFVVYSRMELTEVEPSAHGGELCRMSSNFRNSFNLSLRVSRS